MDRGGRVKTQPPLKSRAPASLVVCRHVFRYTDGIHHRPTLGDSVSLVPRAARNRAPNIRAWAWDIPGHAAQLDGLFPVLDSGPEIFQAAFENPFCRLRDVTWLMRNDTSLRSATAFWSSALHSFVEDAHPLPHVQSVRDRSETGLFELDCPDGIGHGACRRNHGETIPACYDQERAEQSRLSLDNQPRCPTFNALLCVRKAASM
jgi:hypothetical protein